MYVYLIYLAPFLFKVLPSNLCVNLIKKITTKKIVDSVQRYTVILMYYYHCMPLHYGLRVWKNRANLISIDIGFSSFNAELFSINKSSENRKNWLDSKNLIGKLISHDFVISTSSLEQICPVFGHLPYYPIRAHCALPFPGRLYIYVLLN